MLVEMICIGLLLACVPLHYHHSGSSLFEKAVQSSSGDCPFVLSLQFANSIYSSIIFPVLLIPKFHDLRDE